VRLRHEIETEDVPLPRPRSLVLRIAPEQLPEALLIHVGRGRGQRRVLRRQRLGGRLDAAFAKEQGDRGAAAEAICAC
jgi:hypothetical protein